MISKSTATVGKILKENGYNTSWFGKNHNNPDWESSVFGPFDRSPTGLGLDYFYGFIGGATNQYYPVLLENTAAVEPLTTPDEGYHFMTDMTRPRDQLTSRPARCTHRTMSPPSGGSASPASSTRAGKRCARKPTSKDYTAPFAFDGTIDRIEIEIGEAGLDPDEEAKLHARFTTGKEH